VNNLLQYDQQTDQCVLEIASLDSDDAPIRLGIPFLKSFYSIYRDDMVGLALSTLAPTGSIVGPAPVFPDQPASIWNLWTYLLIGLLVLLIVLILGLLCYMRQQRTQEEKEAQARKEKRVRDAENENEALF